MKNKTKRILSTIFAAIIFCVAAYALGWVSGEAFDTSHTYEAPAIATEIDKVTGWVTLTDWAGESWCIRGEGYEVGQLVIAVFNDNSTPDNIYDDAIVQVKTFVNEEVTE